MNTPANPSGGDRRQIRTTSPDPAQLKALAHPERLHILGLLRIEGPATATQLAKRMGLNSGATSYHLRQLARHGFIEAADDLGDRRDRWWRAAHESTHWETAGVDGDALEVGMAMTRSVLATHMQQMQLAHESYRELPVEWQNASTTGDYVLALDAAAANALKDRIEALLTEAMKATPSPEDGLKPGERMFTVMLHTFPHPGFPEDKS